METEDGIGVKEPVGLASERTGGYTICGEWERTEEASEFGRSICQGRPGSRALREGRNGLQR